MTTGIGMTLSEIRVKTQIDPGRAHQSDRIGELAEFFNVSEDQAEKIYSDYNLSKKIKMKAFDPDSWETVFQSYNEPNRITKTISRMMLGSNRIKGAARLLNVLGPRVPDPQSVHVIDYGCGAADFALTFAAYGFFPVIVDIEGPKLDFAKWRFRRRAFDHLAIAVTPAVEYPPLPDADIILAGELLEHLRDPVAAVTSAYRALKPGGYLWLSSFPFQEKEVGGDHLQSAADARLETLAYLDERFEILPDVRFLMRKRGPQASS